MNEPDNRREIAEALGVVDELLPLVDKAERDFKSARGWGVVDILGGGLVTNLIKHARVGSAKDSMYRINDLLRDLRRELSDISVPSGYEMEVGGFSTFADFFFDGILADVYMQSKILSSLNEIRDLRERLLALRKRLRELEART